MYIIVDARLPEQASKALRRYGKLLPLLTKQCTYDSISGHPDLFFCPTPTSLVCAPNTPEELYTTLIKAGIESVKGSLPVSPKYPGSAAYNAFTNHSFFIHNTRYSDPLLLAHCDTLQAIHVNQGYTRCNLTEAGGLYMTSDKGMERILRKNGLDVFFIKPDTIRLPGERHGFFGGCTGHWQNNLFLTGSCDYFPEGSELKTELTRRGIEVIELYNGPLFDAGSILCLG